MNTIELMNLVRRHCPDYDDYEILNELNDSYNDVFETIQRTEPTYYANIGVVTVAAQTNAFDLLWNSDGSLDGPLNPRMVSFTRVRIYQQGMDGWRLAVPNYILQTGMLAQESIYNPGQQVQGPFYYRPFGKGNIKFGLPLPIGTKIEIAYQFVPLPLAVVRDGSVAISTTSVTGTGTNFTNLLPADYRAGWLPGDNELGDASAELILEWNTYRVKSIASDTALTLYTAPPSALTGSYNYALSTTPDFPEHVHHVIADVAIRQMYLEREGQDGQSFVKWDKTVQEAKEALVRSLSNRQNQRWPRKIPFHKSHRNGPFFVTY